MQRNRLTTLAGFGVISVACWLLYVPRGLCLPFVWDGISGIVDNRLLRSLVPTADLWGPPNTTLAGRPLTAFTIAVDRALYGQNVIGYHVTNIVLHNLAALMAFLLIARLYRPRRDAKVVGFLAAMLWMLHPLCTMPVVYVVQRGELLASLFFLTTLYCSTRSWRGSRGWAAAAVVACLAGMASKEIVFGAPLVVLLLHRAYAAGQFRRALGQQPVMYGGFAACMIGLVAYQLTSPRGDSVGLSHGVSAWQYLVTQAGVITHYARLGFWPKPLVFSYHWPLARGLSDYVLPGLGIAAVMAVTGWGLARNKRWAIAPAAFFIILAPSSSVVPIVTEVATEHRMYLPLLAGVLTVLCAAMHVSRAPRWRRAVIVAWVLGAAGLAGMSYARLADYQSSITLLEDTLQKQPHNYQVADALAVAWQESGALTQSERYFQLALKLKPDAIHTRYNYARLAEQMGRTALAVDLYEREIQGRPSDELLARVHNNLGSLHYRQGRLNAALANLRPAVEIAPDYAIAHFNLALCLEDIGRVPEAMQHYQRACDLEPTDPRLWFYYGCTLATTGDISRAADAFAVTLQLDPGHQGAHANLERIRRSVMPPPARQSH